MKVFIIACFAVMAFATSTRAGAADICAVGNYKNTNNDLACEPCPKSTYSTEPDQATCLDCSEGLITLDTGSATPDACTESCTAGAFRSRWDKKCYPCSYGFYQPQPEQTSCIWCGADLTTRVTGAISQSQCTDDCRPGNFRNSDNACERCPFDTYQPDYEQWSCLPCPTDYYTLFDGAFSLDNCNKPAEYQTLTVERDDDVCWSTALGKFFYVGESWNETSGCDKQQCQCTAGGETACAPVACPEVQCGTETITREGECCPICPVCEYEGTKLAVGETVPADRCSSRTCDANGWMMGSQQGCAITSRCSNGAQWARQNENDCCAKCPSCKGEDGTWYYAGAMSSADPCQRCSCDGVTTDITCVVATKCTAP